MSAPHARHSGHKSENNMSFPPSAACLHEQYLPSPRLSRENSSPSGHQSICHYSSHFPSSLLPPHPSLGPGYLKDFSHSIIVCRPPCFLLPVHSLFPQCRSRVTLLRYVSHHGSPLTNFSMAKVKREDPREGRGIWLRLLSLPSFLK